MPRRRLPVLARVAALLPALALAPMAAATAATPATQAAAARAPAGAAPAGAAPAGAVPAGAVPAGAVPGPAAASPLLLINGDSVTVPHRGPGVITPSGPGLAGSVLRLSVAGTSYAIPAAAVPYLGRGLDPSLFEMPLLARRESAGRLPVEVGYAGRVPRLPGITVTRSGGGTADGYLTPASARAFGAALLRQFAGDHAKASYGQDGLFRDGVSVSLAGTAPARAAGGTPRARAGFALHRLTVTGTNLAGKGDTGDVVLVFNADNTALFGDLNENLNVFFHGTARFSVPPGHYWAVADFVDFSAGNKPSAERAVVLPQFTVRKDATVLMAERAADSRVSISAPRPSVVVGTAFDLRRVPRAGQTFIFAPLESGAFPLWVSPTTARPTAGSLQDYTDQWRASPAGATPPQEYDLARGATGIIPRQDVTAAPGSLATIHARYYSGVRSSGDVAALGLFPAQLNDEIFGPAYSVRMPRAQTEYLTGNPSITWWQGMGQYTREVFGLQAVSGGQFAGPKVYHAGQVLAENWDTYPLHTGVSTRDASAPSGPGAASTAPSATRAGNVLNVQVTPFSDSNGHGGEGFLNGDGHPVTGSYEFDENGKKVSSGTAVVGPGKLVPPWAKSHAWQFTVSSRPSILRFKVGSARTRPRYPLSTTVQTTWTWRSAPRTGSLPGGWQCAVSQPGRRCTVEPLMTLGYQVRGLGLNESAPPGRQALDVTAGHLQLARSSPVTRATVQVSFDNGKAWQHAHITAMGGGHFRAVYTAPAGARVTLRVSAADAAHGQITETITRAYLAGPSAAAMNEPAGHVKGAHQPDMPGPEAAAARPACPAAPAGHMRCLVIVQPGAGSPAGPAPGAAPAGWGAKAIESAYRLPAGRGTGQTVAVVDAFRTPGLAGYLNVYRKQYGLPACGTAGGCLRIVNQSGHAAPLPRSGVNTGWDLETTLDADMVSAACPHCKILVVEADSAADQDLAAAENTAARLGAQVISNSYGARELGEPVARFAGAYHHPGHTIVVSSGDEGFTAAQFPADLASVTAVGGTELSRAKGGRGWRETTWDNDFGATGSGCSAYVARPAWQHGKACGGRTAADVSAVASNLAVYEKSYGGWVSVAGTSAAAPIVAGVYALAGNATTVKPGYEYGHAGSLFDVTTGSNNLLSTGGPAVCGRTYLCMAGKGYDAPTGLGTPDGTGGF